MGSLYTSTIKIADKSTIESQELDSFLDFFSYPIKVKRLLFYRAFRMTITKTNDLQKSFSFPVKSLRNIRVFFISVTQKLRVLS